MQVNYYTGTHTKRSVGICICMHAWAKTKNIMHMYSSIQKDPKCIPQGVKVVLKVSNVQGIQVYTVYATPTLRLTE